MSAATVDATVARIAEHVAAHRLSGVDVILHGGEPLLAGHRRMDHLLRALRGRVGPADRVRIGVQTNGVLLDDAYLELFRARRVRVGVSLDGAAGDHDRRRRRADGGGSYEAVRRALRRFDAPRYRGLFGGLLCTVDLRGDPVATYEELVRYAPPVIDFLLPHGNWTTPPPDRVPADPVAPYGDWLVAAFDRWYGAPSRETGVRLFDEIMSLLLGGTSTLEGLGGPPTAMVVVETDGAIEGTDMLASAYPAAAATALHVTADSFDAALAVPGPIRDQYRWGRPTPCAPCPILPVCGGGLPVHRYRAGAGFDQPSVYCPDLYRLITHIRDRLSADVAALRGRAA
jgi:uncharacterized protein